MALLHTADDLDDLGPDEDIALHGVVLALATAGNWPERPAGSTSANAYNPQEDS